jgi:2-amino-4-hydroxy-6-hydroxymethyldihydropteridine diphosphokinase
LSAGGIFIALGANLPSTHGTPRESIEAALRGLSMHLRIESRSRLYETPAWPDPADPRFVNAVACIRTGLSPGELLKLLHDTETAFGRTRSARNAPRSLDLDLIDYDGRIESGPPELPHPRMAERAFVLVPMAEIAPGWRHPVSGLSIEALLAALPLNEKEAVRTLQP